ncbi:homoaconitase [Colletotrichum karsti]|uniref:Homoaconitase, mitochondrial n=1 Tax=Colletotrichum karsti TaxID=1095194 RepID=A0A9P6I081_9PEZI|nr:homoaconitase [Colletotrichum karsti]KAF9874883.1 homoaconitase [Colletotrichum karsti]
MFNWPLGSQNPPSMLPLRRAVALHATRSCRQLALRHVASSRLIRPSFYTTTTRLRQNAFHSQLESAGAADFLSQPGPKVVENPQTITEKIVQRHSVGLAPGKKVRAGDYVTLRPHKYVRYTIPHLWKLAIRMMSHDNTWPIAMKFMSIGATEIADKSQLVFTIDHDVQNESESNVKKYKQIGEFARKHGITFFPEKTGIGHQHMIENGFAWPGSVAVASDSHSNMYGGVGALVPPVCKLTLKGVLPPGVTGKDVIVALCGLFNKDEVLNHCVEFHGSEETMRSLSIDDRLTIANMTTEHGAASGIFPMDSVLKAWMTAKATTNAMLNPEQAAKSNFTHERIEELFANPITADTGAVYAKELYLDLSTLGIWVSGPNSVKIASPLEQLEKDDIPVNKAYLVSCTNSRASDIASAARVFREAAEKGLPAKIAPGVKFYIAAASINEQRAAEETGDWQVLKEAGAIELPSGCGPCIGLGTGLLEEGEVGISASNRNFKGRMGSTLAKAYLASPAVVAASALKGKIAGPEWYQKPDVDKPIVGEGVGDMTADIAKSIEDALAGLISQADGLIAESEKEITGAPAGEAAASAADGEEALTEILPGFPEKIEGEIVFCDADNLNTDGIYPGKYTYQDNVSTEKMAEVCMENYDLAFRDVAKAGDILVSGLNFGSGSSREQAATAILAKGIPMVVAGSFSNIFSRNSVNNALMAVEVPKLVTKLREAFNDENDKVLTRRTGWKLLWDVRRSKVVITEKDGASWSVKVGELPPNVQEIIAKGGLEKWVKSEIGL